MKNTYNGAEAFTGCLLVLIIMVLWAFIMALPTMWLWNWLMPHLFNLPSVTWTEALGINLLCGFLFKGSYSTNTKS